MSSDRLHRVLLQLRHAAVRSDLDERSDAELLHTFIEQRDETAFAALVRRHAAMVLGVCRRVTGDAHDAEDAFQAAFCVLLRKAASIRRREVLGSWLYGVAYRTALAAKLRRAKTRRREHQVDVMPQPLQMPPESNHDWQPLLDAALQRLPEKYRVPIILCDLEGKSRKDAARQLQLSEGTLSSRLARGRRALAQRLRRQGLTLSGGGLAAILTEQALAAQVPGTLVQAVSHAGAQWLLGHVPAALIFSRSVLALTEGVMKAFLVGKLKTLAVILTVGALFTFGSVWLGGWAAGPPAAPDVEVAVAPEAAPVSATDDLRPSAVSRSMFRVESSVTLHDGAGKPKTFVSPVGKVPLGEATPFALSAVMERAGKPLIVRFSWTIEIVRARGNDVLVNLSLAQKERRSNALVRGQSLEFEDFVATNNWKEISDPSWPGGDLTFKFKISPDNVAAQPGPANQQPIPPAFDPRAGAATPPDELEFTLFKLQHADAGSVASTLKLLMGEKVRRNFSIAVDERTNTLLLRSSRDDRDVVSALVQKLDAPAPPPVSAPPRSSENPQKTADPAPNRQPGAQSLDAVGLDGRLLSMAISPDGQRMAIGGKAEVFILDTRTGLALARSVVGDEVKSVAFSPDGKLLASGSDKGSVRLHDAATGKEVRRIETAQKLTRIEFAVDGPTKITVLLVTTTEPAVRVWDLNTGKLLRVEPKAVLEPGKAKAVPVHLDGKIEKLHPTDPNLVHVSIGSDQGLKADDVLEVYRLDPPTYLGQLRVVDVTPQQAVARSNQRTRAAAPPLRVGDRVTNTLHRN